MWYLDYYGYDTYLNSDPSNMPGWETHPVPRSAWHATRSGIVTGKLMGRDAPFKILPPLEEDWQHKHRLVAVSQSDTFSLGLCSCGKVFIDGFLDWRDYERKCEMVDWKDVVAIASGPDTILALRKDGTVLMAISTGPFEGLRTESPLETVAISINRHYEGNDKVLVLDIHGHAVRELLFYEELPWDNWDEK